MGAFWHMWWLKEPCEVHHDVFCLNAGRHSCLFVTSIPESLSPSRSVLLFGWLLNYCLKPTTFFRNKTISIEWNTIRFVQMNSFLQCDICSVGLYPAKCFFFTNVFANTLCYFLDYYTEFECLLKTISWSGAILIIEPGREPLIWKQP